MQVVMEHEAKGTSKLVKLGFSWPLFLFSWIYGVPLFMRGLHLHGSAMFALCLMVFIAGQAATLIGLLVLGAMIFYGIKGNELTGKHLLAKGWQFAEGDSNARYAKARWGLAA